MSSSLNFTESKRASKVESVNEVREDGQGT